MSGSTVKKIHLCYIFSVNGFFSTVQKRQTKKRVVHRLVIETKPEKQIVGIGLFLTFIGLCETGIGRRREVPAGMWAFAVLSLLFYILYTYR